MESSELKKIWHTLADNDLIDQKIAKENIHQMITKKGRGLIDKMAKKIKVDYFMYLIAMIVIPLVIVFVNIVLKRPSPILQIVGVAVIEGYLVYMFLKSRHKIKSLYDDSQSRNINDSLLYFREKYQNTLRKEMRTATLFGYFILTLALVQFFVYKGSIFPIDLTHSSSLLLGVLISMLIFLPFILKMEYKHRFSGTIEEINSTIEELKTEA